MNSYGLALPMGLSNRVSSAANDVVPGELDTGLSAASTSRLDVWLGWLVRPLSIGRGANRGRWVTKYVERLIELERLEEDWDSFGGRPLQRGSVSAMNNVLVQLDEDIRSEPVVTMTPEGGLNCEWSSGEYVLELTSHEDLRVDVYFSEKGNEEYELSIQDAPDLRKWLWQASAPAV